MDQLQQKQPQLTPQQEVERSFNNYHQSLEMIAQAERQVQSLQKKIVAMLDQAQENFQIWQNSLYQMKTNEEKLANTPANFTPPAPAATQV